jgi:hypothetical protein
MGDEAMKTTSKILLTTLLLGGVAAVAVPVVAQNASQPQVQAEEVRFEGQPGPSGHGPRGEEHRGPRGHGGPGGPGQLLRHFDADEDGTITAEEITAKLATYDANNDGNLGLDEFEGLWAEVTNQMMVRSFQFLDRDGDASVTETELSEPVEHFAERMAERQDRDDEGPRHGPGRPWR